MSELKTKQVFSHPLQADEMHVELNAQQQFSAQQTFVPSVSEEETMGEVESQLEQVIRPARRRKGGVASVLTAFSSLVVWQAIDSVFSAIQSADWLSLGWAGFVSMLTGFGITALGREWWRLRQLRQHFSVQEQAEALIEQDAVGQGRVFCEQIARQSGIEAHSPAYTGWLNIIEHTHSDAFVLVMYDAMVLS